MPSEVHGHEWFSGPPFPVELEDINEDSEEKKSVRHVAM